LDGRVASCIDFDTGWQALMNTAEIDDQDAIDEYKRVVIAEELQLERTVESEKIASLDGEPGVVEPPLIGWDPVAIRMLAEPRCRVDARRKTGRKYVLIPPAAIARAE